MELKKEAVETLVEKNLRLVPFVAHKYLKGYQSKTAFEDLIGAGNIGLVKAAQRFDPSRGVSFTTYAVSLIYGEMRRYLRDDNSIHYCRRAKDVYAAIRRERLEEQDPEKIAERLAVKKRYVLEALCYGSRYSMKSIDQSIRHDSQDDYCFTKLLQAQTDFDYNLTVTEIKDALGADLAQVFEEYYINGYTQQHIAAQMNSNQTQISRSLNQIRNTVRRYFSEGKRTEMKRIGDHEKAIDLLKNTVMPLTKIQVETGVPYQSVAKYAKIYRSKGEEISCQKSEEQTLPIDMCFTFERQIANLQVLEMDIREIVAKIQAARSGPWTYTLQISNC